MRNVFLAAIAVLIASPALAADWQAVAEKTRESIVYINSADGSCTGFVIDADAKGDTDRILTAAHCDSEPGHPLFADSAIARVIWKNAKADLMILEVADTGRPAIAVAKHNPKTGEELASYGYGYALERPMLRTAHVSDEAAIVPGTEGGPFVMIDAAFVPGQSGGPCVNAAGEVVSIVQMASDRIGIGVGAETIRSKAGRYLPKP